MKKRTSYKKYLRYEESDFLSDPSFQEWAFNPTPENERYWRDVEGALPEKKAIIQNAFQFLKSIRFKEHFPAEEQVNAAFDNHLESLRSAGMLDQASEKGSAHRSLWRYIRAAAAVLTGILFISGLYFFLTTKEGNTTLVVAKTAFGETRYITLPDGSHVQLNANSNIRYPDKWEKGKKREIWLEGEAFFNVVHLNADTTALKPEEYFIVHTKGLSVTVLGTVFDVRQRRDVTEVVLQRGKVRVSFDQEKLGDVLLTPGKRVVYSKKGLSVKEDQVEAKDYTAWKEKKLLLINPTLKEITQYLEDNFGQKITVSDQSLNDKRIAGPIPLNTLNDALFVISTVSDVDVIRTDSSSILLKAR